jgi:dTDP-glucose 4,6-dehydratase
MTILQFAHRIIELTGSSSRIAYVQPEDVRIKDDPKVRQPDIGKARRVLSWEPRVSLEEGLGNTIEWFRDRVYRIGRNQLAHPERAGVLQSN